MEGRVRRTSPEVFMDKLQELASQNGLAPISTRTLRDALHWDEAKFSSIKAQLMQVGRIERGEGHGTVTLSNHTIPKALRLVISYAHEDKSIKDALVKHLEPLKKLGLIESWDDQEINAGEEWKKQISQQLEKADIILLLISIDFINSSYCTEIEVTKALERRKQESNISVIPVILRNCLWKYDFLSELNALPQDGMPVCSYPDRDDALVNVAAGIQRVAQQIIYSTKLGKKQPEKQLEKAK